MQTCQCMRKTTGHVYGHNLLPAATASLARPCMVLSSNLRLRLQTYTCHSAAIQNSQYSVCKLTHCSDVQAFRGIWRMQQGSQGPNSCRLSYALFVRPQVWLMHAATEDCHCGSIAHLYCAVPKCRSMHKACHLMCMLTRACLFWLVYCFPTQRKLTHIQNCTFRDAMGMSC